MPSPSKSPDVSVTGVPFFDTNYCWLLRCEGSNSVLAIDPGDAAPVQAYLETHQLSLGAIWLTHHHHDHIGGVEALAGRHNCPVIGARADAHRLPPLTCRVAEGDTVKFEEIFANVIETPGHTVGHIVYWLEQQNILFCGDTLFSLGCGRLFEGTPEQMWQSLLKIRALPDDTQVYCAHEYTLDNARFALTVDSDNPDTSQRQREAQAMRQSGRPTIPFRLGHDKKANPFLRADQLGSRHLDDTTRFAQLRACKDTF